MWIGTGRSHAQNICQWQGHSIEVVLIAPVLSLLLIFLSLTQQAKSAVKAPWKGAHAMSTET